MVQDRRDDRDGSADNGSRGETSELLQHLLRCSVGQLHRFIGVESSVENMSGIHNLESRHGGVHGAQMV